MATLVRRLSVYAFGRARGGSQTWLRVGVALTAVRLLQRMARRREDVVRFELRPRERIQVRDLGSRRDLSR